MDRRIVYVGAIPQDTDILLSNLDPYIAVSKLADAILGKTQILNNFLCTPTAPATLTVNVEFGEIYSLKQIDTSTYGSITTNTNEIVKQGITFNTTNLSCPAPVTVGNSVNYLVQIAFSETDTGSTVLPYYNSADINSPLSGPGNSGTPQNTIRQDSVTINVKTGVSAPTGTQTTPSPDAGFTGAYVVTVANGQTTITSGNISVYSASSFINETLTQKVSIPTGDLRWTQISRIQSNYYKYALDTGIADAYVISLTPEITSYSDGLEVDVQIANTNTGASTLNINGIAAANILNGDGTSLYAGQIVAGHKYKFIYNSASSSFLINLTADSFVANLISNGFKHIAGGLIMQWGAVTAIASGSHADVTYPIPFPNSVFHVYISQGILVDSVFATGFGWENIDETQFKLRNSGANSADFHWLAFGH